MQFTMSQDQTDNDDEPPDLNDQHVKHIHGRRDSLVSVTTMKLEQTILEAIRHKNTMDMN